MASNESMQEEDVAKCRVWLTVIEAGVNGSSLSKMLKVSGARVRREGHPAKYAPYSSSGKRLLRHSSWSYRVPMPSTAQLERQLEYLIRTVDGKVLGGILATRPSAIPVLEIEVQNETGLNFPAEVVDWLASFGGSIDVDIY